MFIVGCAKKRERHHIHRSSHFMSKVHHDYDQAPVTVFIHGTLPPLIRGLVHKLDCARGLVLARDHGRGFLIGKIPFMLHKADQDQFPIERSYLFGWSGKLSFAMRHKSAEELYESLKKIKGPITLIAHSHGGNVALNLELVARERGDSTFFIDRLILLGVPVQDATRNFVLSPIFKKVYVFYSAGDWTQIMDPQGLYKNKFQNNWGKKDRAWFSERVFPTNERIRHIRIFMYKHNLDHLGFILQTFTLALPTLLDLADTYIPAGESEREWCINIPGQELNPHLFIPRAC
jgi:pimeloyl-ACP methyl ester carboxylesterase